MNEYVARMTSEDLLVIDQTIKTSSGRSFPFQTSHDFNSDIRAVREDAAKVIKDTLRRLLGAKEDDPRLFSIDADGPFEVFRGPGQ